MSTNQNNNSKNNFFMRLALMQAYKNLGKTKENPSVGCVIVKNDCVLNASCTAENGRPHAETIALSHFKKNLKNSDLYITLEPCSHYGKTPPCVKEIIKKKIRKVFFSINDPDFRSFNKSKKILIKNNIIVKNGVLKSTVRKFYKSYINYKKNILPYVTAKIAVSNDLFTKNIRKKWVTNEYSRGRVHLMRAKYDTILTSCRTVIKDNPKLTCRIQGLEHSSPSRIILDKNLDIPIKSNIVKFAYKHRTYIFFNKVNRKKIISLKRLKINLIRMPLDNNKNFNLKNILLKVKLLGFSRIFLESGLKLTSSFLKNNLINDFHLFISGKKIRKNGINSFKKNMRFLNKKKIITEKVNLFDDKLISYSIK